MVFFIFLKLFLRSRRPRCAVPLEPNCPGKNGKTKNKRTPCFLRAAKKSHFSFRKERYFPSEFGVDVDRVNAVEPAKTIFSSKSQLRRDIESEGIPYTFVCCNFFTGFFIPVLGQAGVTATVRDKVFVPPKDKVVILGDGTAKVVYVNEADVALYTIKAVDDPRTLNKILYMRPPANTLSTNELVALWENKIGKTLDKVYLPEEQVLKTIAETPFPGNVLLSISHVAYVRGDQTNFEIGPNGVEATQLYPEVTYGTVDEFLNKFV